MASRRWTVLLVPGLLAVLATTVPAAPRARAASVAGGDPAGWSNRRLAAQLVLSGVDMGHLDVARDRARSGVGGVVLFGDPPADLRARLAAVRAAGRVPPLVASDEEGGEVQRLAAAIYPLPSAEQMGADDTPKQVRGIAAAYAARMLRLGVDVDLAPVADLLVPGAFIASEHRAFARSPRRVARYVLAWVRGMRSAGALTTVKHWPGHGGATDTHLGLARTAPWSQLKTRDVVPFDAAFGAHVPLVMVGHLVVPGLTENRRTPASLSPRALHRLRRSAGPDTVILTDSLSMGAIRTSLGLTQPQAAVRALESGADMALVQTRLKPVVHAIAAAITAGDYPRHRAVASARRILAVKARIG